MARSGPLAFYITSESGRFRTDPFSFTCGLWMRVQWIRINPTSLRHSEDPDPPAPGWISIFWAFVLFSSQFLRFLLVAPTFLLFGPLCIQTLLQNSRKNYHVTLVCLRLFFVIFYILKIDKNDGGKFPF